MFSSCLHGDKGIAMLSNKPLEGEVALLLLLSCMQQLFLVFDLGFPFVVASMLARQSKPSVSSILPLWNGLIDAACEAALVVSSSL
jgi:hypothetical protein